MKYILPIAAVFFTAVIAKESGNEPTFSNVSTTPATSIAASNATNTSKLSTAQPIPLNLSTAQLITTTAVTPADNGAEYFISGCLLAIMNVSISINYETSKGSMDTAMIDFTKYNTTLDRASKCKSDTESILVIDFDDVFNKSTTFKNNITFVFKGNKSASVLDEITVKYDLKSSAYFKDPKIVNGSSVMSAKLTNNGLQLYNSSVHFTCPAVPTFAFPDNKTKVMITDAEIQPFGVGSNAKFTTNKTITCPAPPAVHTTVKPPVAPSYDKPQTLTFNTECLLMEAGIALSFQYEGADNQTKTTSKLQVPKEGTEWHLTDPKHECNGSHSQTIVISHSSTDDNNGHGSWLMFNLAITVAKENSSDNVNLQEIELWYTIDSQNFPSASPGDVAQNFSVWAKSSSGGLSGFTWKSSEYYTCDADTSFTLNPEHVNRTDAKDVTITFNNFKLEAFRSNNKTSFANSEKKCTEDMTSAIVPIIVGAALAGLVVIVLIAYLIGRRRSRGSGYENI